MDETQILLQQMELQMARYEDEIIDLKIERKAINDKMNARSVAIEKVQEAYEKLKAAYEANKYG